MKVQNLMYILNCFSMYCIDNSLSGSSSDELISDCESIASHENDSEAGNTIALF